MSPPPAPSPVVLRPWRQVTEGPTAYVLAVVVVTLCTLLGLPLRDLTDADNLTMVYMTGVVISAAWLGVGPSILASVLSVAAFNFFFTRPYYSFRFDDQHYYVTFAVMLVTSLVVGSLTARVSHHAQAAHNNAQEAQALYRLARELATVTGADAMARAAASRISSGGRLVRLHLWTRTADGLEPLGDTPAPSEQDLALFGGFVADPEAGRRTGGDGIHLALRAGGELLGLMSLSPMDQPDRPFSPSESLQFETVATLIAQALLRARETTEAEAARVESENERLRNVLLASISHDLRNPLTAMNGGLGTLLRMRRKLPREAVDELTALWNQLGRLQTFVDNLLRMAALTSGHMKLNRQPYLLQEIIGAALIQVEAQRGDRHLRTAIKGALPLVDIDGALIEQVFVNLLGNAVRHTADQGTITISASRDGPWVEVVVADDGPGLGDDGAEARLFAAFHSDRDDAGQATAGLGLAICRGVVQAHGGRISARTVRHDDGRPAGAAFTFTLPVAP